MISNELAALFLTIQKNANINNPMVVKQFIEYADKLYQALAKGGPTIQEAR